MADIYPPFSITKLLLLGECCSENFEIGLISLQYYRRERAEIMLNEAKADLLSNLIFTT